MIRVEKFNPGTYRNQGDFKSFIPTMVNDQWGWESGQINHLLSIADKELGGLNTYSELIPDIEICTSRWKPTSPAVLKERTPPSKTT